MVGSRMIDTTLDRVAGCDAFTRPEAGKRSEARMASAACIQHARSHTIRTTLNRVAGCDAFTRPEAGKRSEARMASAACIQKSYHIPTQIGRAHV